MCTLSVDLDTQRYNHKNTLNHVHLQGSEICKMLAGMSNFGWLNSYITVPPCLKRTRTISERLVIVLTMLTNSIALLTDCCLHFVT